MLRCLALGELNNYICFFLNHFIYNSEFLFSVYKYFISAIKWWNFTVYASWLLRISFVLLHGLIYYFNSFTCSYNSISQWCIIECLSLTTMNSFLASSCAHSLSAEINLAMQICRNMILENLSRIEHVPSTQFHDRPSDPEAPEEVSLIPLSIPCFNLRSLFFSMFSHLSHFAS